MQKTRVLTAALLSLLLGAGGTAHAQRRGDRRPDQSARVSPEEQRQRVQDEQRRATQYRQHIDQRVHVVQQQTLQLQQQKRLAQFRAQQDYALRLQRQRERMLTTRDYSNDPYINAPPTYRYTFDGARHETNQYGADVLRQAVNNGYQEGLRAGSADQQDHWTANYSSSAAYRDADYGYTGSYVDEADYNYYFRQGFRRGYDDGYANRMQYGTTSNGNTSILSNLLTSILGFQPIR